MIIVKKNKLTRSRGCPPPFSRTKEVVSRHHAFVQDDGHAIKLGRAAALCQELTKKYEDRDWVVIKGDDTWMRVHHLIADSVAAPGPTWVRTTGVDQSWDVSGGLMMFPLDAGDSLSLPTCVAMLGDHGASGACDVGYAD